MKLSNNSKLITVLDPRSPISEGYRILRTNIQFSACDNKVKIIYVTSALPGEGKSTTAANLAITFAQSGCKTILVDCDLRKPNVHREFDITNKSGLSNLLIKEEGIDETIYQSEIENLHILTSGIKPPNPSELLASHKMQNFVATLGKYYDIVILDAPPVAVVTDAQIISQYSDGGILVVAAGESDRSIIVKAKQLLEKVNSKILGVVLNKVDSKRGKGKYYYYYYDSDGTKTKR